jgi:hypothetical protein
MYADDETDNDDDDTKQAGTRDAYVRKQLEVHQAACETSGHPDISGNLPFWERFTMKTRTKTQIMKLNFGRIVLQ